MSSLKSPRNRDASGAVGVLVLPMPTARFHLAPSLGTEQSDDVTDLWHSLIVASGAYPGVSGQLPNRRTGRAIRVTPPRVGQRADMRALDGREGS